MNMEGNLDTIHHLFSKHYKSEQDCMDALIAAKWPSGFVCPKCNHTGCSRLTSRRIPLFECGCCGHQTSPLVGTLFEGTHLPLLKWFQTIELFLLPDGISAMRLHKAIRVTYKTAWLMLHKIRHAVGEFDARERLSGDVKVNCDQYGTNPSRCQFPNPFASAVVVGCTVTESGDLDQIKIHLLLHKRGTGNRATRHELAAFINEHVDVETATVDAFPLAYKLYLPLRRVVRDAWESLKSTYVALGPKYLQAYLNEYTVRRRLHLPAARMTMHQKLVTMCMATPAISYNQLITRQPKLPLAIAA
ncbi:transposase [Paenibacillus sp. MBLB2552]|uniref:Transposase n=1 Tax=Paenibacillus mellifer TaxID=2937794 RepID=A0A9X1Y0I5_9BACL|nr:transposase [Paenibacillus mellifer]MCK8488191.1 transposase [Paenibacillus mellifer]